MEADVTVLLMFHEYLPTYVKLGYTRYAVRVFSQNPMQCNKCKKCGHVSSVYRLKEYVIEESVNVKCYNCGGDHISKFPEWPVRVKEVEGSSIRAVQQIAYVEGVKSIIGAKGHSSEEDTVVDAPQPVANVVCQSSDLDTLIVKKVDFVAFI